MGRLKAEPARPVRSLDEFFALAYAVETDAAAHYAKTAEQLRARGARALAEVFERLTEVQLGHASELASRARTGEKLASRNQASLASSRHV